GGRTVHHSSCGRRDDPSLKRHKKIIVKENRSYGWTTSYPSGKGDGEKYGQNWAFAELSRGAVEKTTVPRRYDVEGEGFIPSHERASSPCSTENPGNLRSRLKTSQ
ncbi:MAG: hypothetical protein P8175_17985, partial [Deltaproteobacteria bacterium]